MKRAVLAVAAGLQPDSGALASSLGSLQVFGAELRTSCPDPPSAGHNTNGMVLTDIVKVFEKLDCPYNLHAGTLLNFVRDCASLDSDLDLAIPLTWWNAHADDLEEELILAGFERFPNSIFGTPGNFGYENAWTKRGIKVDLFSRVDEPTRYVTGLWKNGTVYQCPGFRSGFEVRMWGDLPVRVPVPAESALKGWYGSGYLEPFPGKWRWFEDAFDVGSCERKDGIPARPRSGARVSLAGMYSRPAFAALQADAAPTLVALQAEQSDDDAHEHYCARAKAAVHKLGTDGREDATSQLGAYVAGLRASCDAVPDYQARTSARSALVALAQAAAEAAPPRALLRKHGA